jgi:LCP family protein required for cell wall assembly
VENSIDQEYGATVLKGYRNIALFGVDSTEGRLGKGNRSDTIMVASVNLDNGEVRLVSLYRDTYLNVGDDSYNKCNVAYFYGGPEQAINMMNMNLDLNISDFVTVGFRGLTETIDKLGGVWIEVIDAEIEHLNNYQTTMADEMKRSFTPVTQAGRQKLEGLQATAYCRIRYTRGDDFRRAERQRTVLQAVMDEAKKASPSTLTSIAGDVFSYTSTSLELNEIVSLLGDIGKYEIVAEDGFPQADLRTTGTIGARGSCIVPLDLEKNVVWLHEFLFGSEGYQPSAEIRSYSETIHNNTRQYLP